MTLDLFSANVGIVDLINDQQSLSPCGQKMRAELLRWYSNLSATYNEFAKVIYSSSSVTDVTSRNDIRAMATAMHADFDAFIGSKPFSYEMPVSDGSTLATVNVNNLIDNKGHHGIKVKFGGSNPDPATLICFAFSSDTGDGVYGVAVRSASSMSIMTKTLRSTNPYFVRSVPYLEDPDIQIEGKAWGIVDYTPIITEHVPNDIGLDLAMYTQSGILMERETHHLNPITDSVHCCLFDEIALTPVTNIRTNTVYIYTFGEKNNRGLYDMSQALRKFNLTDHGVFDTETGHGCKAFFPRWSKVIFQDLTVCLLAQILKHNVNEEINSLLT